MPERHIRHERATRVAFGLVGSDQELPSSRCIAYCGARVDMAWFYDGADHAALAAKTGGPTACSACVREVKYCLDVIAAHSPHGHFIEGD